jgi:hypothetical protein
MLIDPPTFAAKPPVNRDIGSCRLQQTPQGIRSVAGLSSHVRQGGRQDWSAAAGGVSSIYKVVTGLAPHGGASVVRTPGGPEAKTR